MAARKHLTLFGLVSEMLEKVVELDAHGTSLEEVLNQYRIMKTSSELGFIPVPETLWYDNTESCLKADRRGTMTRFAGVGEWIGKYVATKSTVKDPLGLLKECLAPLTNDSSEFSLREGENLTLRCVNSRQPASYAEPFSALMTRAVEGLGYQCSTKSVSKGMIILDFRKKIEPHLRGEIIA